MGPPAPPRMAATSMSKTWPWLACQVRRSRAAVRAGFDRIWEYACMCILWMDEIHFSPPKTPWNDDSPVNTNRQCFPKVSWVMPDFVHPPYGCGSKPMVRFLCFRCTPISEPISGDWDVHWGYGILTHGQNTWDLSPCLLKGRAFLS